MYFCTSDYFKTSEKKTPIDPDKISEETFNNNNNLIIYKALFTCNDQKRCITI
jgi:predicted dithiol-disulfide oxidoreductase (DUF899 family)